MKILFVLDEYPFPSRNGITLPTSNFIRCFQKLGWEIDLLIFNIDTTNVPVFIQQENIKIFNIDVSRKNIFLGLLLEIFGIRPIFQGWNIIDKPNYNFLSSSYDLVWSSPIRAFSLWILFNKFHKITCLLNIAAINDSYTLALLALASKKKVFFKAYLEIKGFGYVNN